MDKKILIKNARAIVSCDGEDRVYRDADMLIEVQGYWQSAGT